MTQHVCFALLACVCWLVLACVCCGCVACWVCIVYFALLFFSYSICGACPLDACPSLMARMVGRWLVPVCLGRHQFRGHHTTPLMRRLSYDLMHRMVFAVFSMTPKTDALGLTGPSHTRAGGQISEGSSRWLLICSLQLDYFQRGARMRRPAAQETRACKRWSQPASGKTTGGVSQLQAKPPASRTMTSSS